MEKFNQWRDVWISGIKFSDPIFLDILWYAAVLGVAVLTAVLIKLFLRPRKTNMSHFSLFGADKIWLSALILLVAVIVSLARPQAQIPRELEKGGLVLILGIDDSFSMEAKDLKPSRLEAVKGLIYQMVSKNIIKKGDSMVLFTFARSHSLILPFEEDLETSLRELSEIRHPKIYTEDSKTATNLGDFIEKISNSIDKAENALESWNIPIDKKSNRIMFLFSDGDDEDVNVSKLNKGLAWFQKKGIPIHTVAVGKKETVVTVKFKSVKYHAMTGKMVVIKPITIQAKVQPKNIRLIANSSGGQSFNFDSEESANLLDNFQKIIDGSRKFSAKAVVYDDEDRWWDLMAPVFIAGLFLFVLLFMF